MTDSDIELIKKALIRKVQLILSKYGMKEVEVAVIPTWTFFIAT